MINFLDAKLLPKLLANPPATDNYEATNLLSENASIRSRGYLAYTVTKPPVCLEFEFICPVEISHIALNTTVGNQKCSGIELFVKTSTNNTCYTSLARAVYMNKSGVIFCNSHKYPRTGQPVIVPGFNEDDTHLGYFKSDCYQLFRQASALKVVIFRTERSVPCLGSIQVIGRVSRQCSSITRDTINKLLGRLPPSTAIINNDVKNEASITTFKIPEDFKDQLTYEIMAIPMTLPSGKTVDKETLDKHVASEAQFGRQPCDPFTGLKFTRTRKAVLNVALKSRIDMFLLQNAHNPETFTLKRTVASDNNNCGNKRRRTSDNNNQLMCSVCERLNDTLYVWPCTCSGLYCKLCLLQLTDDASFQCNSCKEKYQKCDVKRYHY